MVTVRIRGRFVGRSGFTLMELLITITILSVVVLLIQSALRISISAWEKGAADISLSQDLRGAVELFAAQVAMLRTDRAFSTETGGFYLRGDSQHIAFVTVPSMNTASRKQPIFVSYEVVEMDNGLRRLLQKEQLVFETRLFSGQEGLEEPFESVILASCKNVFFDYLKEVSDTEGYQWQPSWDPSIEKQLPKAVRMTIITDALQSPIRSVVRIIRDPMKVASYNWSL